MTFETFLSIVAVSFLESVAARLHGRFTDADLDAAVRAALRDLISEPAA